MSTHPDSQVGLTEQLKMMFPQPEASPYEDESLTVLNPERRLASGNSGSSVADLTSGSGISYSHSGGAPSSTIWHRLFPTPTDDAPSGDHFPSDPRGIQVGHFVVEHRIGSGGMGAVFRALDTRLHREVALKVLTPGLSRDLAAVKRFQNEARAAARLDHENIARVYFIGEDHGLHYIAFEFITGTNVRDLIRARGKLDVAEAVNYTLQVAAALQHTAVHGVVHRDIKPSNIIITPKGRAKLVDLGLARSEKADGSVDLTMAGTTLGTFDYISPEQAKDPRNVDVRSDIYSLGCTLYHMLTGEPPYPEGTMLQKLLDHQRNNCPDTRVKNPRVPPELAAIVRKMMASEMDRRYASPDYLIKDLMPIAAGYGFRGVSAEGLVWMSQEQPQPGFAQRNLGWMIMTTALLLFVAVLDRYPEFGPTPNLTDVTATEPRTSEASGVGQDSSRQMDRRNASSSSEMRSLNETAEFDESDRSEIDRMASNDLLNEDGEGKHGLPLIDDDDDGRSLVERMLWKPEPMDRIAPFGDSDWLTKSFNSRYRIDEQKPKMSPPRLVTDEPTGDAQSDEEKAVASRGASDDVESKQGGAGNSNASDPVQVRTPLVGEKNNSVTDVDSSTPYVVFDAQGTPSKKYRTLEAACQEAPDGSVIELHFNGVNTEKPIKINEKTITIRGAKGFRPAIEFKAEPIPGQGHQTHMISVANGSLNFFDINLTMHVDPKVVSDKWVLFSLQAFRQLRLQGVLLTVENPDGRNATICEVLPPPAGNMPNMNMMDKRPLREPYEFELNHCLIRGDTRLFEVATTEPGRFNLVDTAVAIDGRLLLVRGDQLKGAEGQRLELRLEHVTAILGDSLVHVESGEQFPLELLPLFVTARNNLFAFRGDQPLISMRGNMTVSDFQRLFRWNGSQNFHDQRSDFWTITSTQGLLKRETFDVDDWLRASVSVQETGLRNDAIYWENEWTERPFVEFRSADFELLDDREINPARSGAADGSAVGAKLLELPFEPPVAARTPK